MKLFIPLRIVLYLCLTMLFLRNNGFSQCPNGAQQSVLSYDTLVLGGGNTTYNFNFPQFDTNRIYFNLPQFDPSKGTLYSVELQTLITVKHSYKVENEGSVTSISRVRVLRSDTLSSAAFLEPYIDDKSKQIGIHTLTPTDGITGSGPDFAQSGTLYSYNNYSINYNIYSNLAGFLGNGEVLFNYGTSTDLYSSGSNNVFTSSTEDSIYFKLVYHYCLTSLLPADINNFNATKKTADKTQKIELTWTSPNDLAGNKYEMQKSNDGKNYASFETITSKSSSHNDYRVFYNATGEDKNKVFFRIKQTDADGSFKYSDVKTIMLEYSATTMKVYPTITRNNVSISFPYAGRADYTVSIINMTGQVMQQADFTRTNLIKLTLNASLKEGTYIISVINKQSSERQISKLMVQ